MRRFTPATIIVALVAAGCTSSAAATTTEQTTPPVTAEAKATWVEYDACILSHFHEQGIAPVPAGDDLGQAMARAWLDTEIYEVCDPLRPVPYPRSR